MLTVTYVATVVKRGDQVIGHVPERLARIITPILEDGQLRKTNSWTTGPKWSAPEGVWRTGRGIELPCCYVLYGLKESRKGI